ncbi:Heptaprenyl diphosphate synthase component I [uncultured Roseburia sp.]|uniref:Gx transporter family protein n=1 Tax=Brotonthovivens ammoniilytica TaxID=2981725 RepID=A0ABT2TK20_9FIRM|nr:Gx transporter family protein [Brotonthovivens ammoniilytica]MCU6762553.1 Gx transporter family protein [Brotonthovivens ammoniilytica]SCI75452.1 Heptaprenyl diphosphate synthase component I [uncultured Roseburia sp.]
MTKKIALLSMLVALALVCSYVEVLVPIQVGLPGMKLGLANLVIVTGLYFLNAREILAVSIVRIMLSAFMFGNGMSLIYSLAGGVLSLALMLLLKKNKGFSIVGISIAGGVFHNVGQLLIALVIVDNINLVFYFPVLMVAGALTGTVIGIVSKKILEALKKGVLNHTVH